MAKLQQFQLQDGGFVWYAGSPVANRYITMHILQGLGQMQNIGVDLKSREYNDLIYNGLRYLNNTLLEDYKHDKQITKSNTSGRGLLTSNAIMALYSKSYFAEGKVNSQLLEAREFYTSLLADNWTSFGLSEKAMIALILHRNGRDQLAVQDIMRSLYESSTYSDELGRYWLANRVGYSWNEAPVETHSLLIETFSEIGFDGEVRGKDIINELKIWLLKNKQTNRWKTTKATTAAVNAIMNSGTDWITTTTMPDIILGGQKINPNAMEGTAVEAGTGYFKQAWSDEEIITQMGELKIQKEGEGIAWGALYWQYFEDLDKITPADNPLQVNKKLFIKTNTDKGELLIGIDESRTLSVGDLVRVRIEIKVDWDMSFVHLKDMRASGMEPVNVLSSYKYREGLGYFESTRDVASHFYFERLPKGVFVFEYDLRISHQGQFSNGITTIQSMYAPEFTSHSEGIRVEVK